MSAHIDGDANVRACHCRSDCQFPCWQREGLDPDNSPCCPVCRPQPASARSVPSEETVSPAPHPSNSNPEDVASEAGEEQ